MVYTLLHDARRKLRGTLADLLGRPGPGPGCDACVGVMDEVAEAQASGDDQWARRFPEVPTHLRNCTACREDVDGLRTALD